MKYRELWEDTKDSLESRYNFMLALGNYQEAYEIIGELMRFKMIEEDDYRLQKKYLKDLQKYGVDTDKRFVKDLREIKYSDGGVYKKDFYPDNLFEKDLYECDGIDLVCKRHWAEHRELGGVGSVLVNDRVLKCTLSLANNCNSARKYIDGICELYKEETGKNFKMDTLERVEIGQQKIYEINLNSNQSFNITRFGYVIVDTTGDGDVRISIIMRNKEFMQRHISIKDAHEVVKDAVIRCLNIAANSDKLVVRYLCQPERYYKKQQNKFNMDARSEAAMEIVDRNNVVYNS